VNDAQLPTQAAICSCFNNEFTSEFNVSLIGGADEPDYVPPQGRATGMIYCREDFASSALHEAAHWCVAGAARRALRDYGYGYAPPPRTAAAQAEFFRVERLPQALECWFSLQLGIDFRASADDPTLPLAQLAEFERQVRTRAANFEVPKLGLNLSEAPGLPLRARRFGDSLRQLAMLQLLS
jgi:elongation factor P hydroxylase